MKKNACALHYYVCYTMFRCVLFEWSRKEEISFTCISFAFDDRDSLRARFTGVFGLSSFSKTYSFGSSPSSVSAYSLSDRKNRLNCH